MRPGDEHRSAKLLEYAQAVNDFSVRELLERHSGDELELHARTVNPQFVRMLRAIGFDRRWARAEGAHLYDAEGDRYLDWLGGFGMYNVGRNNPRVRAALQPRRSSSTRRGSSRSASTRSRRSSPTSC